MGSHPLASPVIVKKYGNRRLYDTRDSRYITLHELATMIREGADVQVVDAKSSRDLTQSTLVQIILDGRGGAQLLPASLLTQLVRMEDHALAEFLGLYMAQALELYVQTKRGLSAMVGFSPMGNPGFTSPGPFAGLWSGIPGWPPGARQAQTPPPAPGPESASQQSDSDVAALRREVEALKATFKQQTRRKKVR